MSDRAREGLFSSLGGAVVGRRVLDLYAGTGAMGIEALSRGAEAATFVDRSPEAVRAIRANLERTGLAGRASVVGSDVPRFVRRMNKKHPPADLCFLDPPYATGGEELEVVLEALTAGRLAGGFTVVLTRRSGSSTPVIPLDWHVTKRLEYGDTLLILCREV